MARPVRWPRAFVAIDLPLGKSAGLTAALLGLYGLAALGCATLATPTWLGVSVGVAAVVWGGYEVRLHARRAAGRSVVRLRAGVDGEWTVTRRDGRVLGGYRLDRRGSFSHPRCAVAALRRPWRRRWVVIPADATPPDAHRALRVMLRAPA